MKKQILFLVTISIILFAKCQSQNYSTYPDFYIEKLNQMPDLLMTDKQLNLPDGGGYFCGPVSVANSLIYLNNTGFSRLIPDSVSDNYNQYSDLILLLSGEDYMNTIKKKMTPSKNMILGLKKFIKEAGYTIDIEHRTFGGKKKDNPLENIEWLKNRIANDNEIVLFLWITKKIEDKDKIIAGHWVSFVGYGKSETGNTNESILVIQDPGSDINYRKNDYVNLKLIKSDFTADKRNFKNYFELENYDCTNGADNILLAGAISFCLKEL